VVLCGVVFVSCGEFCGGVVFVSFVGVVVKEGRKGERRKKIWKKKICVFLKFFFSHFSSFQSALVLSLSASGLSVDSEVHRVRLSRMSCIIRVQSLYSASLILSSLEMAESNAALANSMA